MRDFMNKFRNYMTRLFRGRYGLDSLSKAIFAAAVICDIMGTSFRGLTGTAFKLLFWIGIGFSFYRIFSRDYTKRAEENRHL